MRKRRIAFIFIIFTFSFLFLSATIINIPADYPQIQLGIDVSANGDTILVQPGTYYENINYNSHNIVVGSLFLTTQDSSYIEQTIIDGSQNGSVVTFENGETLSALLVGFTITNGSGNIMPNAVHCGGGIFCHEESDPTIMHCIVTQNNAGDGGGIFCYLHSDPAISNVEISYNSTYDDGGGLHCNWGSNPILENVLIIENYCMDKGAGICCGHNEHTIELSLTNVLICNNTSGEKGSAIYMVDTSSYFNHVSICDNFSDSGYYGSIYCEDSYININNSIVWNNEYSGFNFYNSGYADVTYSNTQNYFVGIGNIMQDPLFVDSANGDYHLQETSPCINAGDPSSPLDPDGTITDMGTYYFIQDELLSSDFSADLLSGTVPLNVQFNDLSTGMIVEWEWDFNNDGFIDSNEQNPIFTYQQIGTYDVALTISDGFDENTETKLNYITVTDTTSVYSTYNLSQTMLNQNFPNPFNPITTISFNLTEEESELVIYNLKGQEIRCYSLFNGQSAITWDGTDSSGKSVSSGIYLYKLISGNKTYTKKMLLLK